MDFVYIWNTPEGRYMFAYCFACMLPLLGLAGLAGYFSGYEDTRIKRVKYESRIDNHKKTNR